MLLLLSFVSSSLLLPAGRCVRLPARSRTASSSSFRARNIFPNGPARQVAVNAGSATQAGLASPNVAARAGKVEALIDSGQTVEGGEWPNGRSLTLLEGAIIGQNVEVVKALLEAGASLEAEEGSRWSPLMSAIVNGANVEVVKALLEAGASLEAEEGSRWSPLMSAIVHGANVDVVKALLEAGASLEGPPWGRGLFAPLGSAIRRGEYADKEVIQALIDAGASLEAGRPFAFSPLTNAIQSGNVEVVQALIDAGASLDASNVVFSPTPLESAIRRGNVDVIKVLLEASLTANPLGVAFALIWNLTLLAYWAYVVIRGLATIFGS